jgi:hypothetical protein
MVLGYVVEDPHPLPESGWGLAADEGPSAAALLGQVGGLDLEEQKGEGM